MSVYAAAVIGAGPAGLFAALRAAGEGRRILALEKKPSPGRKLLLAGSGQCNLTQDGDIKAFLARYGDNGIFLKPALMGFTNKNLVDFFEARGVPLAVEPGGKIFPVSRKSADILAVLVRESEAAGVEIRCGSPVEGIAVEEKSFRVKAGGSTIAAEKILIATGGITYPATGSTGDGYGLARSLGHRIVEAAPALCAVYLKDHPFAELAGISFDGLTVHVVRDGRRVRRGTGDVLLTHSGLSGPGVIDLSRFIRVGDTLEVSFLPDLTPEAVEEALLGLIAASGRRHVATILGELGLPERFVQRLIAACGIPADLQGAALSKPARAALVRRLTAWPLVVEKLGGIHEAMVTRGGVSLAEVDPKTMRSRLVPGLFFAGEVLDVDGDTGGYNLQAAFSTGALAARHLAAR